MQHFAAQIFVVAFLSLDHQQVLLGSNFEILRAEASQRQCNAVIVIAAAFDIERGVIVASIIANLAFELIEQAIEANGSAAIRGKI